MGWLLQNSVSGPKSVLNPSREEGRLGACIGSLRCQL